jgi:hypothetical protein
MRPNADRLVVGPIKQLFDKFSLFEINRYLINLCQIIQTIQKGDFWGKNRLCLAF